MPVPVNAPVATETRLFIKHMKPYLMFEELPIRVSFLSKSDLLSDIPRLKWAFLLRTERQMAKRNLVSYFYGDPDD